MAMPRKQDPYKTCKYCGSQLHRKRMSNGDLESMHDFKRRQFCGRECWRLYATGKTRTDSPSWMTAHYRARKICPPGPCEICGNKNATEVHHKNGDWRDNNPTNLIRLCRSCHLKQHRKRGTCKVCGKPVKGLGYCDKHYQRFKKYGNPLMTAYGIRP